jgi:hypothetical protein
MRGKVVFENLGLSYDRVVRAGHGSPPDSR